jgi:membrane protein DedA with SNARE-associated domain
VEALLDWLAGQHPAAIYTVIGLLAAVENIFPPAPADFAIALGAFLAARGAVSVWGIYVVTVLANVLGALLVFELSRHYGRRFLGSRLGRRLVSEKAQLRIERLYHKYHLWGIFLSRLLPVYRTIVPPFAAAIGLPARKALPPVAVATALYYGALTAVAYELGANWDTVRHMVARIGLGLGIAALAITVLGGWLWWRHRHPKEPDGSPGA